MKNAEQIGLVRDPLVKKRIHVTTKDIDGGVCCSASRCAVSRAMIRALPGRVNYESDFGVWKDQYDRMAFKHRDDVGEKPTNVDMPDRICKWINTFDRDKTKTVSKRTSFTITVPKSWTVPRAV